MQQVLNLPVCAAFTGLSETATSDLMKTMHLRTYRRGAVLFDQGEEPYAVFFVESGRIKWHKVNEDGNEQILQVVERGEAAGLVALLDRRPYVASATVLEDSTVWVLSLADFDRLMTVHPELGLHVMRLLGDGVRVLLDHMGGMANRSAHERVGLVLVRRAERLPGGQRVVPLTHQEIAHLGGMARETVSRVLADFQRRGAVRLARNAVILLDASQFTGTGRRAQSV